ncbi:MAG: alpha-amylase family glycosyl hydrolase [Thermodesulfovibrionales bacterium]
MADDARPVRVHYREKPDYTKPLLDVPEETSEGMRRRLVLLYGEEVADQYLPELERILKVHYAHKPEELIERDRDFDPEVRFTEKDIVMITYGDLLRGKEHSPLASLAYFLKGPLKNVISTIHILPFFPYSSDRGFSITDFRSVDPKLGNWDDIREIGREFKLLFDGVLNHASAESIGFQEFLNDHPRFRDIVVYYRSPDELPPEQRRHIRRPRTSDILTRFDSITGPVYVWTTFSPDQVDLNYRNPRVLMFVIDVLLMYVRRGADIIRLDAVTYLWRELGTECASLEQTHEIIKLFRDVLDVVSPGVALLTETNVPHEENVSYFGDGSDEAQMVYNFALPPLVLHAFYGEDCTALSKWASNLRYPSKTTTYFNMLDTHDGVGLQGVKNILSREEIDAVIERAVSHNAFVSYKTGSDGKDEPYEINTTWWGALNRSDSGEEPILQVKRFVAARSISLALKGVPGVYIHGMLDTENDPDVVKRTGQKRDVNRTVIDEEHLERTGSDPHSRLSLIRPRLKALGEIRISHRAFHPSGGQQVLLVSPAVFSVLRISPKGDERILTLTNVTAQVIEVRVAVPELGLQGGIWRDLFSGREFGVGENALRLTLDPYDILWLKHVQ